MPGNFIYKRNESHKVTMKVIQFILTFACATSLLKEHLQRFENNMESGVDRYCLVIKDSMYFRNVLHDKGNGDVLGQDFTNFLNQMKLQKKLSLLFKFKEHLESIQKTDGAK